MNSRFYDNKTSRSLCYYLFLQHLGTELLEVSRFQHRSCFRKSIYHKTLITKHSLNVLCSICVNLH